ncbi:hypothetical protein [Spirillospora albida]|uniref:hypothetical protein n=1 Tax=Spirillospora albida TaxID=58123 RepID=UPI00068FF823|nr:hypothetical protein [Spirillospora albida]
MRWRGGVAFGFVLVGAVSCSSVDDRAVADEAAAFLRALQKGDGAGACARLLPRAAESLESGGKACADEVLGLDVAVGGVRGVEVWGDHALVRAGGQAVFLSRWGPGWRVAAAGCEARPDEPYACEVEA